MECTYCGFELPSNAKFCPKCSHQVKCLECGEVLFKDASICISCGASIKNKDTTNLAVNNIEFTENEQGKSFKAAFTDAVAGNVVETFAQLLPFRTIQPNNVIQQITDNSADEKIIEEVEFVENLTSFPTTNHVSPQNVSSDLTLLEKIFKNKNGVISIYDPRIKPDNRADFIGRITLLFLYYKKLLNNDEVERNDLNNLLDKDGLKDSTIRTFLYNNKNLIENNQTSLTLRPEGEEKARKILIEFNDSSILNKWDLNGVKKGSPNKDGSKDTLSSTNIKSKSPKISLSYQFVSNLNLRPSGKDSLIDFYKKHNVKNNYEYNLIIVYYLEKILGEKNISINHLYTCYKELKLEVPNIGQSLSDTKRHRGWIETKNKTDLKVLIKGENYVEHDMLKN